MHAIEHVISEAVRTEGTAIADAVVEDIPRVGKLRSVCPQDAEHLAIMMRPGLANQTERDESRKQTVVGFYISHRLNRQFWRYAVRQELSRTPPVGFLRLPSCTRHSAGGLASGSIQRGSLRGTPQRFFVQRVREPVFDPRAHSP